MRPMHLVLRHVLLASFAGFCVSHGLVAQSGDEHEDAQARARQTVFGSAPTPALEMRNEREPRALPRLLEFVDAHVLCDPAPLPAGSRGTVQVLLALRNRAVVLPDARVVVEVTGCDDAVSFGVATLRPPGVGRLARRFLGMLVHDDVLRIDVPVLSSGPAQDGKHACRIALELDLTDGEDGSRLGRFSAVLQSSVTVRNAGSLAADSQAAAGEGTRTRIATLGSGPVPQPPRDGGRIFLRDASSSDEGRSGSGSAKSVEPPFGDAAVAATLTGSLVLLFVLWRCRRASHAAAAGKAP